MTEKKIKRINVRVSLRDYELLKKHYNWTKKWMESRHKSFSDYIRYLLDLGYDDYY